MPHQNGAGPDHRGDGGEAQSSVLGWLATATDIRPHTQLQLVRADLVGADTAVAAGITATGHAPLLTLCRRLVEAGHNPSTPLEAYRGTTLCLRARSIGAGARLTVREGPDGKPRFATYRPAPDGRQNCGGQPPTHSNAGEAPAHEGGRSRLTCSGCPSDAHEGGRSRLTCSGCPSADDALAHTAGAPSRLPAPDPVIHTSRASAAGADSP